MSMDPAQAILAIRQAQEMLSQAVAHLENNRPPPANLPPFQQAILRAATNTPTPARTLARRAGAIFNTYYRDQLRSLTDSGYLSRSSQGYRLA